MTVYPWISEAFKIIQPLLPCSRGDAMAKLIEMLPQRAVDAALSLKSNSRYRAANLALYHLIGARLTIDGDTLSEKAGCVKSLGVNVLDRLKKDLIIDESQTGFTSSSNRTYRLCLKTLGWIEVVGTAWKWVGPDDADWTAVTKENQRRKKP